MADTIRIYLPFDRSVSTTDQIAWRIPFKVGRHGTQDDFYYGLKEHPGAGTTAGSRLSPVYQEFMTLFGLTGAGFKVRGRWHKTESGCLGGYEIQINVPVNTVGHNVVMDVSVARAVELAVLMLKLHLLDHVTTPAAIDALNIEDVEIEYVELTDCYDCQTREEARAMRFAFQQLTELKNGI